MSSDLIAQLKEFQGLLDSGAISQEEFNEQKSLILNEIKRKKLGLNPSSAVGNPLSGSTIVGSVNPSLNPLSGETIIEGASSPPSQTAGGGLSGATAVGDVNQVASQVAQSSQSAFTEGSILGDHQILSVLGEGGMGQVFRARHTIEALAEQEGDVAIKMMHAHYSADEQFKNRFIREASLGKSIHHPNIAKVHHVYSNPLALVLEYIDGEELSHLISDSGLSLEKTVSYLRPIAEALDHLHSKGIIHRDIKPANIKINASGVPMLLDFGIAKDTRSVSTMTKTSMAMGTEAYMAPEQMNAKHVGPEADQYALAMTVYECLCGSLPWAVGETPFQVGMRKMNRDFLSLSDKGSTLDEGVWSVLQKGLSVKASDRFETCVSFVEALLSPGSVGQSAVSVPETESSREEDVVIESVQTVLGGENIQSDVALSSSLSTGSSVVESSSSSSSSAVVDTPVVSEDDVGSAPPRSGGKKGLLFVGLGVLALVGGYFVLGSSQDDIVEVETFTVSPGRKLSSGSVSVSGVSFDTVTISGGSFIMGCLPIDGACASDEKPRHKVTISHTLEVMTTEVTQDLYKSVMGSNPSSFSSCGKDCPVENVSWYDAVRFANALSTQEGLSECYDISGDSVYWREEDCLGWRLPTEAEWEYLARGGEEHLYSGSDDIDSVAWHMYNSGDETHPVGQKQANGFGLHDMSGNVNEWTWDLYGDYSSGSVTDPRGPSSGSSRVNRGSGWNIDGWNARASRRFSNFPSLRLRNLGFRLLRKKI